MANVTYFVALPFVRDDDGQIVAGEPQEARNPAQATRTAGWLAGREENCGAIAFSRTGDPSTGDYADAVIIATYGEIDIALVAHA